MRCLLLLCAMCAGCAANFRDANLPGQDFADEDLRSANLRGADLRGANLVGANVESADFRGAHLEGARFVHRMTCTKLPVYTPSWNACPPAIARAWEEREHETFAFEVCEVRVACSESKPAAVEGARWEGAICPDGTRADEAGGTCEGHLRTPSPGWSVEGLDPAAGALPWLPGE